MSHTLAKSPGAMVVQNFAVSDLDYADEIAFLGKNLEDTQSIANHIQTIALRLRWSVHEAKTTLLFTEFPETGKRQITIDWASFQEVTSNI